MCDAIGCGVKVCVFGRVSVRRPNGQCPRGDRKGKSYKLHFGAVAFDKSPQIRRELIVKLNFV